MPIIAEDLGVITPDVVALREDIGAPGMAVLQFAWGSGAANPHLPHNHYDNCVVYPGACTAPHPGLDKPCPTGLDKLCVSGSTLTRVIPHFGVSF